MRRTTLLSLLFLGLLSVLLFVIPAALAQEPVGTPPEFTDPPVMLPLPQGVRIAYQRVDVSIVNQVATTRIDQLFVNDNDWMMEGNYLFPLPTGAAVSELTMWIDGVPIESKILPANEARAIYDEIVRQLRDPALLEYVGQDAIQANVFPIPPGAERRVEIEYNQILPAENGLLRYVYPQSANLYTDQPLDEQRVRVEIDSDEEIRTVYSPSHPVAIDRPGPYRAIVGYEANSVYPDQDFELYYSVAPEEIGLNLLTFKEAGQDGFFLLLVAPTIEADPNKVVAKDVILVLDTSGSMHGVKLAQAQEAARYVVDNLNAEDRFNIVSFSTGTRSFDSELVPAANPGEYASFITSLEAIGGTNISQALLEAMNMVDTERPTTILFLTDGLATEGIVETPLLLDAVRQASLESTRLFPFGVGDDVDTLLLDSLAQAHRGATTYVRPGQQIDEAVSAFYAKISTPVLADTTLDFGDIVVEQLYPDTLPDLFAGSQLVIAGRYREGGPATITLSGDVNGEQQTFIYEDQFFRTSGGDEFIPRLWATRAIGHLLAQIRLHGEDSELVQSIVNLSLRYGIITPYTSFLIEEEDIFTQAGRRIITDDAVEGFAAPAPVSGAEAVEEAAAQAGLADAEAPLELPPARSELGEDGDVEVQRTIQIIGARTFVYRDGVWIDTAYDSERDTPQQIGFAGASYFALLDAAPELGPVLALGERVLVVFDGNAYEIVPGEGDPGVSLPESGTDVNGEVATVENPVNVVESEPTPAATDQGEQGTAGSATCLGAAIFPLFLGILAIGRKPLRLRKRQTAD